jgi:hypothetical protein
MTKIYPLETWLREKKSFKTKYRQLFFSKNCFWVFARFALPIFQAIWTITLVLTVRGSYNLLEFKVIYTILCSGKVIAKVTNTCPINGN